MNAPVRLAGPGEDEVRKQASAALLLFGALTIASAAKRELEGPTAFIAFWSLAAPAASVLLWIRVRRSAAPLATAAVAAATVLIVLTFAVGAATGSSAAADTALGLGLMAIGTAAGLRLLVACGATIASLALLLAVLGPESEALVPAVTGSALMAWGIAGRGAGRTRHSSPPRPSPAISSAQPASFSTGGLARSRERAAAVLCAEAFLEDPAMVALRPGSHSARRRLLRRWFRGLLRIARLRARREPMVALDEGELVALAVAYEPGTYPPPSWTAGLAATGPALAGPRVSLRVLRWMVARERSHPGYRHLYLETLATAPAHQGWGVGTALLRQLCDEADRRALPIALHTNNPRNVPYYERFRFAVERQELLPHGPTEWLMKRAPVGESQKGQR